jgi:hypothetical protein
VTATPELAVSKQASGGQQALRKKWGASSSDSPRCHVVMMTEPSAARDSCASRDVIYEIVGSLAIGAPADEMACAQVHELYGETRNLGVYSLTKIGCHEAGKVHRGKRKVRRQRLEGVEAERE